MGLAVKVIVAFCVGVGVMAGVQSLGLISIKQYLQYDAARNSVQFVQPKALPTFDAGKIDGLFYKPPPVDMKFAQRGANAAVNRQIDLAIRAGQNVPRPVTIPGMPRR